MGKEGRMVAFQSQGKVALFGKQLLQLRIDGVVVGAANIDGLRHVIVGFAMTSETGDGLRRKLFHGPFRSRGSAVVEKGIARQVGLQSKKFTFDFNGVIEERSNSNTSRGIRRAFTRNGEQGRDVDASLEIGYARSDLRNDRTSVTMGDENIGAFIVGQRSDGCGVFGESRCRVGAVPRTR